jgi:hypothetical protein
MSSCGPADIEFLDSLNETGLAGKDKGKCSFFSIRFKT